MERDNLSEIEAELYFLIARFLSGGPCQNAFSTLVEEIEKHRLLPKRLDWLGNKHDRSFENLVLSHPHVGSEHLLEVCRRIGPILDKEVRPSVLGINSLLGAGRQSMLRTVDDLQKAFISISQLSARLHNAPLLPPINLRRHPNTTQLVLSREISGASLPQHQIPSKFYKSMQPFCRRLGHLSSVYCLLFDRTGQYIFTGADDLLVKIWNAIDGRLLLTLRGHSAEITDMAVNYENTLLAAGSCDKIIRVWCLRTTAPVSVLTGHTGMITSLKFCPCPKGLDRYLISTGNDGCVFFWQWNVITSKFNPTPRKFTERNRPGAQMQCSSFSPGGTFLATGSTDHHIRIYNVYGQNGPERILEVEAHSDRVDSIQFANHCERFVSGSKDGTACVWRFERQKWRKILLHMLTRLPGDASGDVDDTKIPKFKVTMVGWDSDDKYVITAVNDFSLKVWNSHNGSLIYVLEGHDDEVFVLEAHPTDPRIILSAGHDGRIILWDLFNGSMIKNLFNLIEGQGHGAVFDCKFSPDGRQFASTDSHGHLSIFGFGTNERYRKIPNELYFHTDYRPLIRDTNHHVLDEQTQQAPHLMPPPFLVNIDGDPYPPEMQRLVPGRENCNDASLVPHVVSMGPGEIEILEAVRPSEENRDNIDVMIEQLQRQRDAAMNSPPQHGTGGDRGGQSPLSPRSSGRHPIHGHPLSHSRVGMRRSGDVEGVRQSHGNWQSRVTPSQGELLSWSRRVAVVNHDPGLLACLEEKRRALSDAELAHYRNEKKRRLDAGQGLKDEEEGQKPKQGFRHGYRTRAARKKRLKKVDSNDDDENPENGEQSSSSSLESDGEKLWQTSGSSDSDSESSEYSDWTQDAGVNLQPPKRGQGRSVRLKKMLAAIDDDDDDDVDAGGEGQLEKRRKSKRRRRDCDTRLSPATEMRECPPEYRPSEWLTETVPHKAPYYPQMGDEVIYFQQGHRCYVKAVKRNKVYKINELNQPWHKLHLRDQELVKVVGIKYEIRPPRLCCLKLAMIDPETGRMTGQSFTIKYHDMPDVIDFLVLRQTYDLAMSRNWKASDKFRSLIDSKWWMGTIVSQEPFEEEFPDSMFQCFNVHWDSKDKEKMSPWDFEPLNATRMPQEHGGSVAILPEELKSLLYGPKESEWPLHGPDEECERILRGIEQIMELSVAEPFIVPVDLNAYPSYARIVEYPIDLSVIRARLDSRFYRRITSVQFDVRYLEHNTKKFNEPGSRIVKQARLVTDLCLKFIEDPTSTDIRPLYQSMMNSEAVLHSDTPDNSPDFDSSEEEITRRPCRKVCRPRKRRNEYNSNSWKLQCKTFLDKIVMSGDSEPFLAPVDPLEYPDYRDIIDTPMDLGTVKEQLLGDNYESPVEFCKDMRLIFQNSRNYNVNKKSKIYSMTIRMSAFFEDRIRGIISDWKSAVKYEQKLKSNKYVSNRRRPIPQTRTEIVSPAGRAAGRSHLQTSSQSNSRNGAGPSSSRSRSTARAVLKSRKKNVSEEEDDKENRIQNGRTSRSKRTAGAHLANGHVKRSLRQKPKGRSKCSRKSIEDDDDNVDVEGEDAEDGDSDDDDDEVEDDEQEDVTASDSDEVGKRRQSGRIASKKSKAVRSRQTKRRRRRKKVPAEKVEESQSEDSGSQSGTESDSKSGSDGENSSPANSVNSEKKKSSSSSAEGSRSSSPARRSRSSSPSDTDSSKSKPSQSSESNSENEGNDDSEQGAKSSSNSEPGTPSGSPRRGRQHPKQSKQKHKTSDGLNNINCATGVSSRSTSDVESGIFRRSRRTSTRNSTKATRNALKTKRHSSEGDPSSPMARPKRQHSDSDDSCEPSRRSKRIATRNLGRRTVRYREDSDFEYSFNDSDDSANSNSRRRKRKRRRPKVPASGRGGGGGRTRRLKNIAKTFIRR